MNTKVKIIIIAVLVVVIIALVVNNNSKKASEKASTNETTKSQAYTEYDEESGLYVVYDENGEEITRVSDEAAAQIYIDNPDYDPKLPAGDYSGTEDYEN